MQKLGTAPAPWLEQLTGAGRGRIFEFDGSRMSIGRSDDNQIVIQDDSVSRVHALIEQNEDGSYVLFDNGSRNGILVNGSRTDGSVISDGDTIQIGNVSFRLSFPNSKGHEVEQRKNGSEPPQLFTPPQPEAPKKPGINRRFILYGGVLLVLGFLYFSSV
ncbi:MAG: FHA domain-containing protein, partial [Proteobacteria bacterium]|nr:FHA domain-containing protein [Pseudomonadota bacterium]